MTMYQMTIYNAEGVALGDPSENAPLFLAFFNSLFWFTCTLMQLTFLSVRIKQMRYNVISARVGSSMYRV